jgi:hypothetical protein
VPFCGRDSGYVELPGVRQFNVCAKRFIELFAGLLLSTRSLGHGLFDADDLMTLRTLAEAMTGSIHFVPWPKPTNASVNSGFFMPQVSHRPDGLATLWIFKLTHKPIPAHQGLSAFLTSGRLKNTSQKDDPDGQNCSLLELEKIAGKETIDLISCEVILLSSPLRRKQEKRATGQRTKSRVGERVLRFTFRQTFLLAGEM